MFFFFWCCGCFFFSLLMQKKKNKGFKVRQFYFSNTTFCWVLYSEQNLLEAVKAQLQILFFAGGGGRGGKSVLTKVLEEFRTFAPKKKGTYSVGILDTKKIHLLPSTPPICFNILERVRIIHLLYFLKKHKF